MKLMIKRRILLAAMAAVWCIAVSAQGLVPLPAVPDGLQPGRERANYIVEHYWDKMPWKTAAQMPVKMETTLRDFAQLLPLAAADTVYASIDKLLKGAMKKPEVFRALMPMAEATFHADTALVRSDDVYLPFAKAAAKFKKLDSTERERYARQAQIIESSSVGKTLPPLMVTRRDGTTFALNDTASAAQTYVIIIETPESGRFDRVSFAANIAARQLTEAELIKPILIYAGEAPEEWWNSTEGLQKQWSVGQLPDAAKYFELRALPEIYLADGEMTVVSKQMPMPALINNCEQLLQSIINQLEQQQ